MRYKYPLPVPHCFFITSLYTPHLPKKREPEPYVLVSFFPEVHTKSYSVILPWASFRRYKVTADDLLLLFKKDDARPLCVRRTMRIKYRWGRRRPKNNAWRSRMFSIKQVHKYLSSFLPSSSSTHTVRQRAFLQKV